MPKPSMTQMLAVALAVSLALSGYLLSRTDVRTVVFSTNAEQQPASASTQPDMANVPTALPQNLDALLAQLQNMQTQMLAVSTQLEQKYPDNAVQAQQADDVIALWTEIEQLNQQMQPLMVQLEAVSASRSSRPASEWYAIRTKVNTIHQRIADLTRRLEVDQARANAGVGAGEAQWAAPAELTANPNKAAYEQLYENMAELQSLMHQLQGNHQPGQ